MYPVFIACQVEYVIVGDSGNCCCASVQCVTVNCSRAITSHGLLIPSQHALYNSIVYKTRGDPHDNCSRAITSWFVDSIPTRVIQFHSTSRQLFEGHHFPWFVDSTPTRVIQFYSVSRRAVTLSLTTTVRGPSLPVVC